ncbi:hypothetical protein UFOVP605_53 [uncultured Caudovirales phage]|uniref:Uncharacterized protein n=1 Tax=uncultured Caudovirales phage TaxID=2100421 RepID=A0A6J5N4H3_9CAUD|nr:hypothetical protein UFOVP605_53 [uncultured Caudovirales phage]
MTRFANANNATAAASRSVRMFIAIDLDFSTGHVYAHDGIGDITFGGNTYLGVGQFGGIEVVQESVEVIARPVVLTLSGVETNLVSTTMTEIYQNRTATLYLGFLNVDANTLIATPEIAWEGRMNQMSISMGVATSSIRLSCEHRLRREPHIARYTDAEQQNEFANDKFFNLLHTINGFVGKWGTRDTGYGGTGSPNVRNGIDGRVYRV